MRQLIFSCLLFLSGLGWAVGSPAFPQGLLLIGFDGSDWHPYVSQDGSLVKIAALKNTRSASWHQPSGQIVYVDTTGNLATYDLKDQQSRVLLKWRKEGSYTQPRMHQEGSVDFVYMLDGSSKQTEIHRLDLKTQVVKKLHIGGGLFFPIQISDEKLLFAKSRCQNKCQAIHLDLYVKDSEQTTEILRTDAVSQQPTYDPVRNTVFFSSNLEGSFDLWQLQLDTPGSAYRMTTRVDAVDLFPAVIERGLLFLRLTEGASEIVQITHEGQQEPLVLPASIQRVRYLEVSS